MRLLCIPLGACLLLGAPASALQTASDDAADAVYDDGWQNGDEGGTGWGGGWELVDFTGNPGSTAAQDVASSSGNGGGDIDTAGRSFRLTASGSGESFASRPLASDLAVGEAVTADLDVAPLNGGLASMFLAGGGPARLAIGAMDTFYYVVDSTGSHSLGVPVDGQAVRIRVALTSPDTYALSAFPASGGRIDATGTMTQSGPIDRVSFDVYAPNAGERTLYFNRIAVPEPAESMLAGAAVAPLALLAQRRPPSRPATGRRREASHDVAAAM